MEKKLLSPYAPDAFTPKMMHQVVLQKVNFELPDHVWEAIDEAFAHYWNEEAGFGGWVDVFSAVEAINNGLISEQIIFPIDKVVQIVEIMFDWIELVPGVLLDDDALVIQHKISSEDLLFRKNGITNNCESGKSFPCFSDAQTDIVYISDKLKEYYPGTYRRLTELFNEMEITWGEILNTKDIWIRDYMPIQVSNDKFLVYEYDPDYLQGSATYITDSYTIYKDYVSETNCKDVGIILDGGNYVKCGDYVMLTDKVFTENGYSKNSRVFYRKLKNAFESKIVVLPWHCDNKNNPNCDVYGHADGLIRWTGGNHLLMSNHRDFDPNEADTIIRRLKNRGWEVTEMLFDVSKPDMSFNWAYINYLQVGNKIIVPVFGIPEDKQAVRYITDANPYCDIRTIRMRDITSQGGALHCITWNIKSAIPF